MKKILLSLFLYFLFFNFSYAENICNNEIKNVDLTVITTGNANIRTNPCIENSQINGVTQIGKKYETKKYSGGYYQIEIDDKFYWIWEGALDIKVNYSLSEKDKVLVKNVLIKLDKKSDKYREKFLEKVEIVLEKYKNNKRIYYIFLEIKKSLEEKLENEKIESENIEIISNNLGEYNINYSEIKDYWLSLYSEVRKDLGLYEYNYNKKLEQTAFLWSEKQKQDNKANHKRFENSDFYNYKEINNWFLNNGVSCKNIDTYTHTENVGRGEFSCNDGECTDELKSGVKRTFDYFMSEKGTESDAHYQSIINDYFKEIGIGISINELKENYYEFYLTIHYCTELE